MTALSFASSPSSPTFPLHQPHITSHHTRTYALPTPHELKMASKSALPSHMKPAANGAEGERHHGKSQSHVVCRTPLFPPSLSPLDGRGGGGISTSKHIPIRSTGEVVASSPIWSSDLMEVSPVKESTARSVAAVVRHDEPLLLDSLHARRSHTSLVLLAGSGKGFSQGGKQTPIPWSKRGPMRAPSPLL